MVGLDKLKELLYKTSAGKGKVVHLHNLGYGEGDMRTYLVIKGALQQDVYQTLRSIQCIGWLYGDEFIAEYEGEITCSDLCPKVDIIWKYKNWNTKWDKDGKGYRVNGKLIYRDPIYEESVKIEVVMKYELTGDVWKTSFYYNKDKFKSLVFKSTSERYAKGKMLDISMQSFPLEFYTREGFKELYGDGISVALKKEQLLNE